MVKTKESFLSKIQYINSFGLHILAMLLMLCDHLWASVLSGYGWLTWIGRLAFPIFAFMIGEGYFYTSNFKRYLKRLFIFALLSEIPFNLLYSGSWIEPFHQNVLWTFLVGLLCVRGMDSVRKKRKPVVAVILSVGIMLLGYLIGTILMMDYSGEGVLTVILFYLFRGEKWWQKLGQLAGLIYINVYAIKGMRVPAEFFGMTVEIAQQGLAVLAIIPIWLYNRKRGPHNRFIQYAFYAFYPVHLVILWILAMVL